MVKHCEDGYKLHNKLDTQCQKSIENTHMYDTHPEQDSPQHRLNVIVCSSDNDWQFVSAVHVIYVGQCQGGN